MRRPLLAALLLTVAGCSWSDLDAEFLAALPQRQDLKVAPPSQAAQALEAGGYGTREDALRSGAAADVDAQARGLNGLIDGLTGGLDVVRQIPPSVREPDRRVWGPYADEEHPGFELQVEIARAADRYTYEVQWRPAAGDGAWQGIISGHFRGEQAANGAGSFTLDGAKARAIGFPFDPDLAQVTLSYDHQDGTRVQVDATATTGVAAQYAHRKRADGSGAMSYTTVLANGWTLRVDAGWLSSRAGRIDAVASHPSWPVFSGHRRECWDERLERIYFLQDFRDEQCPSGDCATGRAEDCRIAQPQG